LDPNPVFVDSILSCSFSGVVDSDGDTVSYSYEWSVNGSPVLETTDALSSGFVANDAVVCSVTPNDGILDGGQGSSSIIVSNSPPVVDSVVLQPDPAYTDSLLTATSTYSDLDGDTMSVTYTWSVGSSEVQSGTDHTLSGSFFSKGDSVSISVIVHDGTIDSSPVSSTLLIQNTPPTSPSVSIDPVSPIEGDSDLICTIDTPSSDIDGDSIDYIFSWTVDGIDYTGATDTSTDSTVDSTVPLSQEEWICTATPNDGTDDGGPATDVVQIQSQEVFLDQLCGYSNQGEFCGGNCTNNTAQFADAYCQIAGYSGAASYTEHSSGSFTDILYYNESQTGLPTSCSDISFSGGYGLNSGCTCVRDLYCQ
jgi:hypothetical protein